MLEEQIFNLKLNSKSLARQSAKCEKDEKTERAKVKAVRHFSVSTQFATAIAFVRRV